MKSVKYNCEVCMDPIYGKKTSCYKEGDHRYTLTVQNKKLVNESITLFAKDVHYIINYNYAAVPYYEIEKVENNKKPIISYEEYYRLKDLNTKRFALNIHKPNYFRSLEQLQNFLIML